MAQKSNSFEGGTDGTNISVGNSGGGSGDAFSNINRTNGTLIYSADVSAHGALGMKVVTFTSGNEPYARYTGLGSLTTSVYIRFYLYFTSIPGTGCYVASFLSTTPAFCASVRLNTTGKISMLNAAGTAVSTSTYTLPINTWHRIEVRCLPSTTVGEIEWKVFLGDSTAPQDTGQVTGQVLTANIDQALFGQGIFGPSTYTFYEDDVSYSDVDWIGPYQTTSNVGPFRPVMMWP